MSESKQAGLRSVDPTSPEASEVTTTLPELRVGGCGKICRVDSDDEDSARLKSMGICEGRRVMLVRRGDPLILRVLGSRIGLSARLAERVRVDACQGDVEAGGPS